MNNETWLVTDSDGVPWELGCRPSRIGDDRRERPARRSDIVGALALKGEEPVNSAMLHEVTKILRALCGWRAMSLQMSAEFVEAEIKSLRVHGAAANDSLRRFQELFGWTKPQPLKDVVVFVEDEFKRLRKHEEKSLLFWNGLCDILSLSIGVDSEAALQEVRELKVSDHRLRTVIKEAEEAGWNGVENSKFLSGFILNQAKELEKRELELDELRGVAHAFLVCGGSDDAWHRTRSRLIELARPPLFTDEERKQKYIAIEADRAARQGKPRGDAKRALLSALHSMRLSGTDDAILRKMAEEGGVEWNNPDAQFKAGNPVEVHDACCDPTFEGSGTVVSVEGKQATVRMNGGTRVVKTSALRTVDPLLRIKQLEDELEYERMRLAACAVAAIDGREQQAIGPGHPYYSAAYGDVLRVRRDADRLRHEVFSLAEEVKMLDAKLREARPVSSPAICRPASTDLESALRDIESDLQVATGNTLKLAKEEVRLLLRAARAVDDPKNDATDGASPAWWRGHDHTANEMGKRIDAALAGIGIKAASWQEGLELLQKPVPMRILCPICGTLHVDEDEFATKVHHTHACQKCGHVWRPAVVATVGVEFLPGFKNKP